ncbi:MAG: DNA ligase, partial [Nanoarchaeota archaeon]|nr:DNA ligase [Nanoarchaeota archaeon]
MKYINLVEIYQKLDSTTKRLEKTYFISELLRETPLEDLSKITLLLQGKIFPPWDERKIGVASRMVLKAINVSSGLSVREIEDEWKKTGDLGKTAENLIKKKKQVTLFSSDLSVSKVFDNLRKLATLEGLGSVDQKIKLISELLTSAKPIEARYIVRTVLEELRVGVGAGSLRDAIAWAFFPKVVGIFFKC